MNVVIHQSWIIFMFVLFSEVYTREVHMTNISEGIGTDNISLRCIYTKDPGDLVAGVTFLAINDSTNTFEEIAVSTLLASKPVLKSYGVYLFDSANITKVNDLPSEVVLIFNDLNCEHERRYRCQLSVFSIAPIISEPIQIFVKVPPWKPDGVAIIKTHVNVSTTTERSTVTKSTFVDDTTDNSSILTSPRNENNQTSSLFNFGASIINNKITSTTSSYHVTDDYNTAEPSTESAGIIDGDTITFKCFGNVGKPAGIFLFKKICKDQIQPMHYTAMTTEIEEIPGNCSYYRTSYLTIQVTSEDNQAVLRCVVVSPLAGQDMYIDSKPLEVKCSSSGANDETGNSSGDSVPVLVSVLGLLVIGAFLIVIIIYIRKNRASKIPAEKYESKSFVDSKPKPIAEFRTGNYDLIDLKEDAIKTQTVDNGHEVEDINKHNEEYLKKQEEQEQKKKVSNIPPQPAVYAQVNEATKSRNKQITETQKIADKQEEDTYAETQEGIYDKAGDRRHNENENVEHFNSSKNSSKQNSDGDTKLPIQTSHTGSYDNQAFEKDENRKIATVSPTIRSLGRYQDDEQINQSRNSQSKKGYANIKGTDQTGTSDKDNSHETEL